MVDYGNVSSTNFDITNVVNIPGLCRPRPFPSFSPPAREAPSYPSSGKFCKHQSRRRAPPPDQGTNKPLLKLFNHFAIRRSRTIFPSATAAFHEATTQAPSSCRPVCCAAAAATVIDDCASESDCPRIVCSSPPGLCNGKIRKREINQA